jgi:hypothetical protein
MKRSGTADLPLHGGRVPPWLANRTTKLGTAIAEQVILNYGQSEFLTRLSDSFWSQTLKPRSIYILEGEARTQWEHSIPPVDQSRLVVYNTNEHGRRSLRAALPIPSGAPIVDLSTSTPSPSRIQAS